jgi:hypothetical protein
MLDRLRVNRVDVHKLLVGIRERYPELESLLDYERVASWEGAGAGSAEGFSNAGRGFGGAVLFVVLFFALIRAVAMLGLSAGDTPPERSLPPPVVVSGPSAEEVDAAVAGVFGPDTNLAKVREADPVFADQLALGIRNAKDNGGAHAFVRHKALQVAEIAAFEELVALGELRRLWLAEAMGNPAQCKNVMAGDFRSLPLELGKAETALEQQLLRRLLGAKLLSHRSTKRGGSSTVPGWVIEQTMKRSGLSQEGVAKALRNPEDKGRCLVEFTMLNVMLKEPGRVPADLLRAL